MRLEHIIETLKTKNTKQKISNYIKKIWESDNIDELLLLIDINLNYNVGEVHVPEFEDATNENTDYRFNNFFKLISQLKETDDLEKKKILIEESALESNEYYWNELYRKVLINDLDSVINVKAIIETLKKLTVDVK